MATNPAAILKKYKDRSLAAVQDYTDGAMKVTVAPTQLAAQAAPKWIAKLQQAFSDGTYVASLQGVSLGEWQQAVKDKGAANYRTGISNLSPRSAKAMADQQAYADQVRQEVAQMPNNSDADADARMLAAVQKMRQYKRR